MLLGERLGGRHQRGLVAVLDGPQHGVQRDDGLAGADLAHQQPLHRLGRREVGVDALDRRLLIAGQRERQRRTPARSQARRFGERGRALRLAAALTAQQEGELYQQQLLEGKSQAALLGLVGIGGEVQRAERGRAIGEAVARAQQPRQRLHDVAQQSGGPAHEREDLRRAGAVAGGVAAGAAPPADGPGPGPEAAPGGPASGGALAGLVGGCVRGNAEAAREAGRCRAAPGACPAGSDRPARAG